MRGIIPVQKYLYFSFHFLSRGVVFMIFNVPAGGITALAIITLCMFAYIKGNASPEKVNSLFTHYYC